MLDDLFQGMFANMEVSVWEDELSPRVEPSSVWVDQR
jgi:hypothetical protein